MFSSRALNATCGVRGLCGLKGKQDAFRLLCLRTTRAAVTAVLALSLVAPHVHAQQDQPTPILRVNSNIVLTNVVVRDKKTGAPIRGLKASDFTVTENGKPQQIVSFDFQTVDEAARLNEATVSGTTPTIAQMLERSLGADTAQLRDHRLIVLFFDTASMQPDDIDRAVDAADDYINKKMAPADLVAVASLGTTLSLDHDFTADKQALLATVGKFNGSTD
ncbi:MAG: VWA domain-containing protein, partial [Terriglobus roseus]|nr:VWA domain-containing protein [Terriglobus roseus]